MTATIQTGNDLFGPAVWIVDPTSGSGTHTTIQAAINSASSGQTIFIRPGTYTENPTLKAGVNLTAYGSDSSLNGTGDVIINGTCTLTGAGSVTISGIQLQTNSAALLAVTGSVASIVNLNNCYLNCSNNTGITFSSSSASAQIIINNCQGNLGTTGIALFTNTSPGTLAFFFCNITNTGASTTASTTSSFNVQIIGGNYNIVLSTSSTGSYGIYNTQWSTQAINTSFLTMAGTGSSILENSNFTSGTASCISIGTNCTVSANLCLFDSSNTNVITGAGTLIYTAIAFFTSQLMNPTTLTARNLFAGGISFDGGNNILSTYTVGTWTPTIVGGSTAGTTTYTLQNGYYTKIGNMATVWGLVVCTAATGTGDVRISALPFTIKNQTNGNVHGTIAVAGSASVSYPAARTWIEGTGTPNTTYLSCTCHGTAVADANLQMANTSLNFQPSFSYQV